MKKLSLSLALAGSTLFSVGCTDRFSDDFVVDCQGGSCDAFDSMRTLISDAKTLDLGDLIVLGAGYATEGLNDGLASLDYASLQVAPTEVYALAEQAKDDHTLNDLDQLVSGLAASFGDSELSTEVNRVRAAYLRNTSSNNSYFAESAFRIQAGLKHGWSFDSQGLNDESSVRSTLGFNADAQLEARIIGAYGSEIAAVANAPLEALRNSRGFVFPRSLADVRNMQPGESFALSGSGQMGINIGAGLPILITEPTTFLTYSVALTAGLRSQIAGQMDVQLVRLEGDEVVVDVGMQIATVKSARIGLSDGWGVHGLLQQEIDIAGSKVDLGRLVEKALQKELNKKLSYISGDLSSSKKVTRMSMARLRFQVNQDDPEQARAEALAQALKGDLRLAQALANRGDSGVKSEFDLLRSGVASASHAGLEIFGMHFFSTTNEATGAATIQTPGGVTSLIFESLHKEGGWFFASHGYGRTGLAGLIFDAQDGGTVKGETNLFISIEEGDDFIDRDKLMDHLDGLIVSIGGPDAMLAIQPYLKTLEERIIATCPVPGSTEGYGENDYFDDTCNINMIRSDLEVEQLRRNARSALSDQLSHLDVQQYNLVMQAGEMRISAQSVLDVNASLTTPGASLLLDYRLDDGALESLFASKEGADLQASALNYLQATQVHRLDGDLENTRQEIREDLSSDVEGMAKIFDAYKERYLRRTGLENAEVPLLGPIGANAVEIRFSVDSDNHPNYEDATSQSLAQARSQLVTGFFDDLIESADDIGRSGTGGAPHQEQTVAYALLGITDSNRLDLRVRFDVDTSGCGLCGDLKRYDVAGYVDFDIRAQGPKVAAIGGGLFDIDSLIDVQ